MRDELQERTGPQNWEHYWSIAKRRRWWALLPFFAAWLIVSSLAWILPATYRSETVILVEQQKVPEQYVLPNVAVDLQERLQSMTQQILSRTRLQAIMEQLKLYSDERDRLTPDELVEKMRKDIDIEVVQAPGRRAELTAFKIYYSSDNPRTAQEVTSKLTSLFIEENLRARQQQSETTTDFLESELETARKDLEQQETAVRQFKTQYLGQLPGQTESNLQILGGLHTRLQSALEGYNQAKQQNIYLQSLLGQYKTLQADLRSGKSPGLSATIDQQLDAARTRLADLKSRYTDRHPDVRKAEEEIAELERMRRQAAVQPTEKKEEDDLPPVASVADLQTKSPMMEIESRLKANELELKDRQQEMNRIEAEIQKYQARLNITPVREQQLADLLRNYEQSRTHYESLLAKKNQSQLATNLEKRQQGEQFRILDPPSLPDKAYWPDRMRLSLLGLLVGLLAAAAFVTGAELVDDRVREEADLRDLVPAVVLAQIPQLPTETEVKESRKRVVLEWAGGCALMFVVIAGNVLAYYRG